MNRGRLRRTTLRLLWQCILCTLCQCILCQCRSCRGAPPCKVRSAKSCALRTLQCTCGSAYNIHRHVHPHTKSYMANKICVKICASSSAARLSSWVASQWPPKQRSQVPRVHQSGLEKLCMGIHNIHIVCMRFREAVHIWLIKYV